MGKRLRKFHYLNLEIHVQVCGGLIEQQHPRFLRQGPRNQHPLSLARRQRRDAAFGKMGDSGALHGFTSLRNIQSCFRGKETQVRGAPHHHSLFHREREYHSLRGPHRRYHLRGLARRQTPDILPVEGD